jgi:hypothetical protein
MESMVAPKSNRLLKRFTYWSAEIVYGLDMPGWVAIHPERRGVKRSADLTPDERSELYKTVIPRLERMIESVLGPGLITHQWTGHALYLIPPKTERDPASLYEEYHQVLLAAAA